MKRGFTLFEILVAVAVIGFLALLLIPHFRSFQRGREYQADIQGLLGNLRWAKEAASSQWAAYVVTFDLAKNRYAITTRQENPSSGEMEYFYVTSDNYALRSYDPIGEPGNLVYFDFPLPYSQLVEVSSEDDRITFTAGGEASFAPSGEVVTIDLQDEQGAHPQTIEVIAATGLVRIQE